MRDIIALQNGLALIPPSGEIDHASLAAALQAELMNLGFMLDAAAFAAASRAPREWLIAYHNQIIPHLRKLLGANRDYKPIYRNFPAEVMEMSNLALFLNAIVHYWSDGQWEPPQKLRDRGFAFEDVKFTPLRLGTENDLKQVFTRLAGINQSLTEQHKLAMIWLIKTFGPALRLPAVIPFKETLCLLAAEGLDVPVKTPTDVLRIAVYMSGGDVSLPGVPTRKVTLPPWITAYRSRYNYEPYIQTLIAAHQQARDKFKFTKFRRPQRRQLLGLLEKTGAEVTEMQRHLGRWLRLGEILHVGEFATRYPRSAAAFEKLRNQYAGNRIRTFAARVDLAIAQDWRAGVELLATRPGEFARRLDWLLRTFDDRSYILNAFARIGSAISDKVLFELYNHFNQRFRPDAPRSVMIKGERAKMKTLPSLPPMERDLVQQIGNAILQIIRTRIGALPPMGKVWIDPRLKEVPIPFAMRSVNTATKTYVRGTHIPYRADAKVIRPFIHWFDEAGDQDLDLSAGFYDASLKIISNIGFTKLKDELLNCCHSGDIVARQGPCAEYVDIDIARCRAAGIRYVTVHVFNYRARPMYTVKDCVFGLMEREHAVANEIFIPKTITNCMTLANQGTAVVVCIIDLEESRYIWADVESDRTLATLENAASNSADVLRALIHNSKMSVYQLLELHTQVRGTQVTDPTAADYVMKWENFITDYSRAAEYMTF